MKDLENIILDNRIYLDETGFINFYFVGTEEAYAVKKFVKRFQEPVL